CCVTHEALRKSRHAASRAARTHRRGYLPGCGGNPPPHALAGFPDEACGATLSRDAFAVLPENVVVVAKRSEETADTIAGDVGAIACVRADARLDRVRAFVKVQDRCSLSCKLCALPLLR